MILVLPISTHESNLAVPHPLRRPMGHHVSHAVEAVNVMVYALAQPDVHGNLCVLVVSLVPVVPLQGIEGLNDEVE